MYPCYQIAVCISLLPELISLDCLNKQFIERDDSIHTGFFLISFIFSGVSGRS